MSCNRSFTSLRVVVLVAAMVVLVVAPGAWAQSNYKLLHRFKPVNGGVEPSAGVIFDAAGNLYGTTLYGGVDCRGDCGTVFKLTPQSDGNWREDILHAFSGGDGQGPVGSLIFDANGNLYGTTYLGGTTGAGTVFKLTPNSNGTWTESVLYTFCSLGNCTDGVSPEAGVIFDQAGNLYGTAYAGGGGKFGNAGGVVFKLTPNSNGTWTESVLYTFCSRTNCNDGESPYAGLVFDATGNLYGTTYSGGTGARGRGGVVFKLAPDSGGGWTESVLYSFCPLNKCRDGSNPGAGLIFDQAGNLYGTTQYGGDPACNTEGSGCGVVFELTPNKDASWAEQVLHTFRGGTGAEPNGLTFGPAGDLYGDAAGGRASGCFNGCGVVFKLAPNSSGGWKETVLHTFVDQPGAGPVGSVIFDAEGNLYGAGAGDGNIHTFGVVFEITP
jgi:uncharacterized repeat protein (TIGR03803 family)